MLDRTLFSSLDTLTAELESVSGHRVQLMVDQIADGFAITTPPSDSQPLTLIRIADRFNDFSHAIAAMQVAGQIRKYRAGNQTKASLNPAALADLNAEVVSGFGGTIPDEKLPGLTQIFYDGIARQLSSILPVAMDHRVVAARCTDLRKQHVRFLDFLIGLNARYLAVAVDERTPAKLVAANHRLLGMETLALAMIRESGKADPIAVIDRLAKEHAVFAAPNRQALLTAAIPIVTALGDGLLDDLSDRQLADLSAQNADVRRDWLDWIVPMGMEANASTPMLPRDLAGKRAASDGTDAYTQRVFAAVALASHGDPAAAKAALLALSAESGSSDQRTMTALAAVHEQLGDGDEAMRVARMAIALDTTTDAAEAARGVINRVSAGRVHDVAEVRPDVVQYIRDALMTYNRLSRERGMGVWKEAAMLGMGGIKLDGSQQYALKSLPGKLMSGVHLTCYTYVGTRMFAPPDMLAMLGLPYDREWEAATKRT